MISVLGFFCLGGLQEFVAFEGVGRRFLVFGGF